MWPDIEKNKMDLESQADSYLSMIDTHGTPRKDMAKFEEFEKAESIRDIFKPDFTVYVLGHCGLTVNNDITD